MSKRQINIYNIAKNKQTTISLIILIIINVSYGKDNFILITC
jgi:hypothetical protein